MYIAIKKNPSLSYPGLKWQPVLMSASGVVTMITTRRYRHIQDARQYASYIAKELNIDVVLKV